MTAQIFSAHDKTGVAAAQKRLNQMLEKESPGVLPPGPD